MNTTHTNSPLDHWLVKAARASDPSRNLPNDVDITGSPSHEWQQVATLFGISTVELARRVAAAFGCVATDLADFHPEQGSPLIERTCRAKGLVPLWFDNANLHCAVSDPRLSVEDLSLLRIASKRTIHLSVLAPDEVDTCLTRLFASLGSAYDKSNEIDLLDTNAFGEEKHIVKLARALFRSAIDKGASDVHVHPFVGGGAIRFRIDGVLRRIATVPFESLTELSRYLGAHAGLEINSLKPRDGRLRLKYGQRMVDVRLSILPVHDGERIVCRLLDQGRSFSLKQSGFAPGDAQALRRMVNNNAGIVLLTGPTGSGKTSTLYALLASLNRVDINIVTIEDPVEYVLPGISQVQVNSKHGLSFADTLRAILRQDPDVILIGEIRDSETARIAAQAALTGHLVLSTLHTNDALGTIPRLIDLGLEPSTLADALVGVVSQRLARKLCDKCRQPVTAPLRADEAEFARIVGEAPPYRAVGCEHCGLTGYKGRLPLVERLELNANMRQSMLGGTHSSDALSREAGDSLRVMAASARDWVVSGLTSPQEVHRALGMGFWNGLCKIHGASTTNYTMADADDTAASESRMSILLVSEDVELIANLGAQVDFEVLSAASPEQANAMLKKHPGVVGILIDGQLLADPQAMLATLRTELAWSGLPVLFIVGGDSIDDHITTLLQRFGARSIHRSEIATSQALQSVVNSLLQAGN
ncbi:PulE Type II secretory pathway, ATPase PulE/Tfp pilus assembly pathway, ATPase PilB [Comamonadaceae bacterium]